MPFDVRATNWDWCCAESSRQGSENVPREIEVVDNLEIITEQW